MLFRSHPHAIFYMCLSYAWLEICDHGAVTQCQLSRTTCAQTQQHQATGVQNGETEHILVDAPSIVSEVADRRARMSVTHVCV